jgi:hypothetical protein
MPPAFRNLVYASDGESLKEVTTNSKERFLSVRKCTDGLQVRTLGGCFLRQYVGI